MKYQLPDKKVIYIDLSSSRVIMKQINACPAEHGFALPLQSAQIQISLLLKKSTDLDLHCLT